MRLECQGSERKLGKKESSIIRSRSSAHSIILSRHQNPSIHIIHSRTQTKEVLCLDSSLIIIRASAPCGNQ